MPKISKYITHVLSKLDLIEAWYRNGATDDIVAKNLNVGYSTYLKYKNEYTELKERSLVGKEEADLKVESTLFKRAIGYEYDEVTYENGTETKRVTKQVAPDTTAQIFWLKNRCPDKWRDKQEVNVSGEIETSTNKLDSILTQLKKE